MGPEHEFLDGSEALLNDFGGVGGLSGVSRGVPGGAAAGGLVNYVNDVAFIEKIRRPASSTVWFDQPILQNKLVIGTLEEIMIFIDVFEVHVSANDNLGER